MATAPSGFPVRVRQRTTVSARWVVLALTLACATWARGAAPPRPAPPPIRATAGDWPQLQHDAQHTGRTSLSVVPGTRAKWVWVDEAHLTRNFESRKNAAIDYPELRTTILAGDVQPIVTADLVFFGATDGWFYALHGTDGSVAWKQALDAPVLHTAAYAAGTVVTGCMDGTLYAFRASDGRLRWSFATEAGISVAPLVMDGVVFVGSRDGFFYAVDLTTGKLRWRYRTVATNPEHPHSGAPIMQSAAGDGKAVYFGAENMYFYALDARTGKELWRKKLGGQSFMYSWPVIHDGLVLTYVMVPRGLSEFTTERELDALPARAANESRTAYAARVWPLERATLRAWLARNPTYRSLYVMRATDGAFPYREQVPMGRVAGLGYPGRAPVLDNAGRLLTYWRTRSSVLLTGTTFGTKYTPDISALNPATGDRVPLAVSSPMSCEIDNNFTLTVGGDYLYLNNHMRGAHCIRLTTGETVRGTSILAKWDGADLRQWGNRLIWIGNDDEPQRLPPPSVHRAPQGDCGCVVASIQGKPILFIQESGHYQIDFGCLAAVEGN